LALSILLTSELKRQGHVLDHVMYTRIRLYANQPHNIKEAFAIFISIKRILSIITKRIKKILYLNYIESIKRNVAGIFRAVQNS